MAGSDILFLTDIRELRDKELYENALELVDPARLERIKKAKHESTGGQVLAAGLLLQYAVGEFIKSCKDGAFDKKGEEFSEQTGPDEIMEETLSEQIRPDDIVVDSGIRYISLPQILLKLSRKGVTKEIFTMVKEGRRDSGQPYLPDHPEIFISLSHSGVYAMCGIADVPIGVDIQEHSDRREVTDIAKRFFPGEESAYLESIDDIQIRRREFYRLWSLHEAYVKNTGNGLSEGFKDVVFLDVLKTGKVCDNKNVYLIDAPEGYSAGVVTG